LTAVLVCMCGKMIASCESAVDEKQHVVVQRKD
jgi:hypothetical protein